MSMHAMLGAGTRQKILIHKLRFVVAGHCRYATALHGRYRGQIFCQRQRSSDSDELRSGETVRALLTHSDNDPLQQITLCGAVQQPHGKNGVIPLTQGATHRMITEKGILRMSGWRGTTERAACKASRRKSSVRRRKRPFWAMSRPPATRRGIASSSCYR